MTAANLIGSILFGAIGSVAFIYGKRTSGFKPMIIGGLLVGFPYFVTNTAAMYIVGVALTISLFIFRD